jgi:hypothetical protein
LYNDILDKVGDAFSCMKTSYVELPVLDIVGLILFLSICILVRSVKSGLIIAFIFSFKFAWSVVAEFGTLWLVLYFFFGVVIVIFAIIEGILEKSR